MRRGPLALALALSGCGHTIYTPFQGDPGAATVPVEAEFCKAGDDATALTIAEKRWDGNVAVARGGGCVAKSLDDAWAALRNGEALKWDGATLLSFARIPDDRVPYVFETKYKAGPPVFAQKWTMQWFHARKDGGVVVRYQKVEGTSYIASWEGTIELVPVADGLTGFAMRNAIEAARTGLEESANSVRDQLARVRTVPPAVEGTPP